MFLASGTRGSLFDNNGLRGRRNVFLVSVINAGPSAGLRALFDLAAFCSLVRELGTAYYLAFDGSVAFCKQFLAYRTGKALIRRNVCLLVGLLLVVWCVW